LIGFFAVELAPLERWMPLIVVEQTERAEDPTLVA